MNKLSHALEAHGLGLTPSQRRRMERKFRMSLIKHEPPNTLARPHGKKPNYAQENARRAARK